MNGQVIRKTCVFIFIIGVLILRQLSANQRGENCFPILEAVFPIPQRTAYPAEKLATKAERMPEMTPKRWVA